MGKGKLAALACTVVVVCCIAAGAHAHSPATPKTRVYRSADQASSATIVPANDSPSGKPTARVARRGADGKSHQLWQRTLVNRSGPTNALLANGASYLVTFDNWNSFGAGSDLVVIYDRRGRLVRNLSLEQIVPPEYAAQLPRLFDSLEWSGEHRLVENDTQLELQVIEPGTRSRTARTRFLPLRIRLADGAVLPPVGADWAAAVQKARKLDAPRQALWQRYRRFHASPLPAPASTSTKAWEAYALEVRKRIAPDEELMLPLVLPAPGAEDAEHGAEMLEGWLEHIDRNSPYTRFVLASPTSDRLAALLEKVFAKRRAGSMKLARLVFVCTPAEGARMLAATRASGAHVTLVDGTRPVPPGKPLPARPPLLWTADDWPR
jgi:hypothetical protein